MKVTHQALVLVIAIGVGAAGCGDAGRLTGATSDAAIDVSSEGGSVVGALVWGAPSPPVEGDGRLVDGGDVPNGFGWDFCDVSGLNRSAPGSAPPSTRGDSYLLFSSSSAGSRAASAPQTSQVYFLLETPGTAQGLWFDLTLISGSADAATISFYETDSLCVTKRSFGTFSVAGHLAPAGQWKTGCLDLSAKGDLDAIGLRIDVPWGTLGFDALRFGKSCE